MHGRRLTTATIVALAAICAASGSAGAAPAPSPSAQADNLALSTTRGRDLSPALLQAAAKSEQQREQEHAKRVVADPERQSDPNPCSLPLCVGDPRLDGWGAGKGIVKPVLFTARDGATLSGHIWATKSGPAKRPGIVIDNGSIIGFEQAYWWAAQTLAKDGYVVMTFDAQGEGDSDQTGASPDQGESLIAGTPPIGDGGPFYDGLEDALDFFLSTPDHPYVPQPSRTSHTSHADKQQRRVAAGLDAASNPLAGMLDASKIGLTGHSYGAYASSYLAQADPRVDAEVAWDTLCVPKNSTQTEAAATFGQGGSATLAGVPVPAALTALPGDGCFGAPPGYAPDVPISKPALSISADYFAPIPLTGSIDPDYKARVSEAYSKAGVDSGQLVIRGGNHLEWSWAPVPIGTLRGVDLSAWYTAAFFDRELKRDPTATARLLSGRWRDDARTGQVDGAHDPNAFSTLYRSRMDLRSAGDCEDLRKGCSNLVPASDDCGPASFGYLTVATTADDGTDPLRRACSASATEASGATGSAATAGRACTSRRRVTITLPKAIRRHGIRSVRVSVAGRKARAGKRARRVPVSLRGIAATKKAVKVTIRVRGRDGRTRTVRRSYRLCAKR